MNRLPSRLLSVSLAVIMLGACSASGDRADPAPSINPSVAAEADAAAVSPRSESPTEPPPSEPATVDRNISQRGNLVKRVGETASIAVDAEAVPAVEWVIDDIAVDGECTSEYAEPPELGHLLVVSMTMSTGSDLADVTLFPTIDVTPDDFTVVGPDGVTENENATLAAYFCLAESDAMPTEIGPGESVVGKVALDTAHSTGVLVYRPWWADTDGGWEWEF